jgi:GTP-binding protein
MPLPLIAIVGRPNVGKSTLFNALVGSRLSITDPTAGTTRDRIAAVIRREGTAAELVDTGGLGVVDETRLEEDIENQIGIAIESATVIVFVVDSRDGVTGLDREVAARLRKLGKPVILAANKADSRKQELDSAEFHALGLGEPVPLSALQGINTREILDRAWAALPPSPADPAPDGSVRLALVGRRNAGKSTFLNALVGTGRVLVSEIPGTTRDAVDVRVKRGKRDVTFIDTAGIIRKYKVDESVAYYAQVRTFQALQRADAVLFLVDVNEDIGQVDKKVAGIIEDAKKPVVIVGNKWDLSKSSTEKFAEYFRGTLPGLGFAPISFASGKEKKNLWQTVDLALELVEMGKRRADTATVTRLFQRAIEERSPARARSKIAKILYATQTGVSPPTFVLFVNEPAMFPPDYRRFLENRVRDRLEVPEIPVVLNFRARAGRGRAGRKP